MAATKSASTLQSSATNTAASTTNSSSLNLTTSYGATITAQVTNGATAPTLACSAIVQVSGDNSTWFFYQQQSAGLTASLAYSFSFDLPPSVMYARVQFTGNTGQSVTVAAQAEAITGI